MMVKQLQHSRVLCQWVVSPVSRPWKTGPLIGTISWDQFSGETTDFWGYTGIPDRSTDILKPCSCEVMSFRFFGQAHHLWPALKNKLTTWAVHTQQPSFLGCRGLGPNSQPVKLSSSKCLMCFGWLHVKHSRTWPNVSRVTVTCWQLQCSKPQNLATLESNV